MKNLTDITNTSNTLLLPSFEKVKSNFYKITSLFEVYVWVHIRESAKVIKNSLKIIVINNSSYGRTLNPIVAKMGATSSISFLIAAKSTYGNFNRWPNFSFGDKEGAILTAISTIVTIGWTLDEFSTALTAFEEGFGFVNLKPLNSVFKIITLPIVLGTLSHLILRRVYDIGRQYFELSSLPSNLKSDGELKNLRTLLNGKFEPSMQESQGKTLEQIKALKKTKEEILTRHTDAKIVELMKTILEPTASLENAENALKDIKSLSNRKIAVNGTTAILAAAQLTAVVASNFFAPPALFVPIVNITRGTLTMATEVYQNFFMTKGLRTLT